MNYPELIWRLIEMLLQKEKDEKQKIVEVEKDTDLNVQEQNEAE